MLTTIMFAQTYMVISDGVELESDMFTHTVIFDALMLKYERLHYYQNYTSTVISLFGIANLKLNMEHKKCCL